MTFYDTSSADDATVAVDICLTAFIIAKVKHASVQRRQLCFCPYHLTVAMNCNIPVSECVSMLHWPGYWLAGFTF